MGTLLLVRHAQTHLDPQLPAPLWELTAGGRAAARRLAEKLRLHNPTRIVTSVENKAIQTGAQLAEALQLPAVALPGFEEQRRGQETFFDDPQEFITLVEQILTQPERAVEGGESGAAARQRFEAAVAATHFDYTQDLPVIVTHGRILTLLLSYHNLLDPLPFWRSLHMPELLVVDYPGFKLNSRLHLK